MKDVRIGIGMCGSFCTYGKIFSCMEQLLEEEFSLTTVFSFQSQKIDSRFGKQGIQTFLDGLQVVSHRGHTLQIPAKFQGCLKGSDKVSAHQNRQNQNDAVKNHRGEKQDNIFHGPVNPGIERNGQKSPCDAGRKTNVPLKIEFLAAVVPIAHFKQGLHADSGDILQGCGADHPGEKHGNRVTEKRLGQK